MFVQTNHIDKVVELTILFCKYDIVISDTLGCPLFVAPCDITRASWETKKEWLSYRKMYIEEFVWGTSDDDMRADHSDVTVSARKWP